MPFDLTRATDLIVFDGTCVFCSGFARFVMRHDRACRFHFVTAQSDLGRKLYRQHGLDLNLMETNIVIVDGQAHVRMAAFTEAVRALPWPWRALAVTGWLPRAAGDWIYERIRLNRYLFGRQVCAMPTDALRSRLIE